MDTIETYTIVGNNGIAPVQPFSINAGTFVPGTPVNLVSGATVMCSSSFVVLNGTQLSIVPNTVMLFVDSPSGPLPSSPCIFTDTAIPVDIGGGKPDED